MFLGRGVYNISAIFLVMILFFISSCRSEDLETTFSSTSLSSPDLEMINDYINASDTEKYNLILGYMGKGRISMDSTDKLFIVNLKGGEGAILCREILTMLCLLSLNHSLEVKLISGYETQDTASCNDENDSRRYLRSAHYQGQAMDILTADGIDLSWQNSSDPIEKEQAKAKIRELVKEILHIGSLSPDNYLPTQLIIQEWEDVVPHLTTRDRLYGDGTPGSSECYIRGGSRKGFSYDHNYRGKIHIGY